MMPSYREKNNSSEHKKNRPLHQTLFMQFMLLFLLNILWDKWFDVSQSWASCQLPVANRQYEKRQNVYQIYRLFQPLVHRIYGGNTVTTVENCLHRVKYVDTEIPHKCWLYTQLVWPVCVCVIFVSQAFVIADESKKKKDAAHKFACFHFSCRVALYYNILYDTAC